MNRLLMSSLSCCTAVVAPSLPAASVDWRVALSYGSAGIVIPQLPPAVNGHNTDDVRIADSGVAALGFSLTQSNGPSGLWSERGNGQLLPFAQNGVSGATGPGRSGGEAGHVFRALHAPMDSIGAGYRVFGGEANDPAAPANDAIKGLWQFDGVRNVEFARFGTDGALGPGMGTDWTFASFTHITNVSGFANVHSLRGHRAVMNLSVKYQSNVQRSALVQYVPGVGNVPCMVEGSTNPAWSPNLPGLTTFNGARRELSINANGDLYGGSSNGLWKFCDGAPQPQAVSGFTGTLGPGLSTPTAYFSDVYAEAGPGARDILYFSGAGDLSTASGAPTFRGLFLRSGGSNRPMLLHGVEGVFGPKIPGQVFATPSAAAIPVKAAGRYAVISAAVRPVGSTSTSTNSGLWRVSPEEGPMPLLLIDDTGSFAPAAGRKWTGYYGYAVFDNGDVIVLAQVSNPTEYSLWKLRPGLPPEELLGPGDGVSVPFASGTALRSVTSISVTPINNQTGYVGSDGWTSADGSVILPVQLQGLTSTVTLRGKVTTTDLIFADGLD